MKKTEGRRKEKNIDQLQRKILQTIILKSEFKIFAGLRDTGVIEQQIYLFL